MVCNPHLPHEHQESQNIPKQRLPKINTPIKLRVQAVSMVLGIYAYQLTVSSWMRLTNNFSFAAVSQFQSFWRRKPNAIPLESFLLLLYALFLVFHLIMYSTFVSAINT